MMATKQLISPQPHMKVNFDSHSQIKTIFDRTQEVHVCNAITFLSSGDIANSERFSCKRCI